jgi:hypothetical protein
MNTSLKHKNKKSIVSFFDLSVSNPPFQDSTNRNTTPHKLWIDFTHREFDLLHVGGRLAQISPNSFLSPSSKILRYFLSNQTEYLGLDTSKFFTVGSTFADYVIKKIDSDSSYSNNTTKFIERDGHESYGLLDNTIFYLPNDFNCTSLSIHRKVIFENKSKLNVKFDYVTCHNVVLKKQNSTLSKIKTTAHVHPIFHTNPQIWWSSIQQPFATKKKVMWTRSGYTKPFYDDGKYGVTDMGYYVEVDDRESGENLAHNLNSKLFQYIFKTAKWSGFGNELVFSSIPSLPNIKMSDEDLFSYFNITDEEIAYIKSNSESSKTKKNSQTVETNIDRDDHRISQTAEVFTPNELADRLIDEIDEIHFRDATHKILESSAGNGQLIMAILRKMKKIGRNDWKHIIENQLFICEYMKDNIEELLDRISSFTGLNVRELNHNIIWADFISFSSRPMLMLQWPSNRYHEMQSSRLE